jgi:hypothetical protein
MNFQDKLSELFVPGKCEPFFWAVEIKKIVDKNETPVKLIELHKYINVDCLFGVFLCIFN